jgi:small subunit ribosomal protein S9
VSPGQGNISVNGRPLLQYVHNRKALEQLVLQPLVAAEAVGKYDVMATACGGGVSGQAGAVRHGISKALLEVDANLRPLLRQRGLLTRDPRAKERKKYGRKRARRGFQFTKR